MRRKSSPNWVIPASYVAAALIVGTALPRIETRFFPGFRSGITPTSAIAIYGSIGTGMLALTGIVFALMFVIVQFSSTAYSPRLALWLARDRVTWHALGVFTATFLYSIDAMAWIDRDQSTPVPFISGWLVIVLLLLSVAMFVALIERISLLQINNMLSFIGERGRKVIENMYPDLHSPINRARAEDFVELGLSNLLVHCGCPRVVQTLDSAALLKVASDLDGRIEVLVSVGDTVVDGTPLLEVHGAKRNIDEQYLKSCLQLGPIRTFDQDPKYAIRLLVDIAIRALSPAINDPTTAVQALDQIEDLLLRLGKKRLENDILRDPNGVLRLVLQTPAWEDFLILALDEIRLFGAHSVQVIRRMNALILSLIENLPSERLRPLIVFRDRISATITKSFEGDVEEMNEASRSDRQGLGMPVKNPLAKLHT